MIDILFLIRFLQDTQTDVTNYIARHVTGTFLVTLSYIKDDKRYVCKLMMVLNKCDISNNGK